MSFQRLASSKGRLGAGLATALAIVLGVGAFASIRQFTKPHAARAKIGVIPNDIRAAGSPEGESARCDAERKRVLELPGLPGAPELEAKRGLILGHAKADPVLFVRTPELEPSDDKIVKDYRKKLSIAPYPWDILGWLAPRFVHHTEHGRATILREGYLYTDKPDLAFALVDRISIMHLASEDQIYIQRGGVTRHAKRTKTGNYVYTDGPEAGHGVRLLLFDRVGTGTPPPPLHRDLRSLRYRLHFDSMKIVHLTEDRIVADLKYGEVTVPSLLASNGAHVELVCESVPKDQAQRVAELRAFGDRKERVMKGLRRAMINEIEDGLPFDEPRREWGQQDGWMRYHWLVAYLNGQTQYRFNKDMYPVYGVKGDPIPPQVCIDFVYDTLERASGTWWERMGQKPHRVVGKIDFKTSSNTDLRRADGFLDFAKGNPGSFDVYTVPYEERIEMWRRQPFFAKLIERAEHFQTGDVVMIRGYTPFEKPWQRKVMHYHSFYVYEQDPVTGMPIALVGNPGRPSIRPWLFEGLRTPKRSVWYSIRPKLEWLESIIQPGEVNPNDEPPTLSVEPT